MSAAHGKVSGFMAAADSALEVRSGAARQCNRQKKDKSGTDPRRPGTTRTIDLDGNPRAVRTVDMGAYERQGACN